MVSVLIPSRNERFLGRTIADVLAKAEGPIEILVSLDNDHGWAQEPLPQTRNVVYLQHAQPLGMRAGLAQLARAAQGEWLFKLDAHCIVCPGFDTQLVQSGRDNQITIPRRFKLDEKTWQPKSDFIDYEHFIWPRKFRPISLHGFRWDERTTSRAGIDLDDTLSFQGSAWFMAASHFERHQFFTDPGYEGLPQQEAEELGLTTWTSGGRVVVDKRIWYAHWFKGKENGIGYYISKPQARRCYEYSYRHWVLEQREAFQGLIADFWPLPGWPDDWQARLYQGEAAHA
jgi:glycosyltransferase involved in cell wall biosynthesis